MNVISHKFNVLNALDRERFSDLKLVTECGQSVSCHKVVAGAVSKKLSGLLGSKPINELTIRNVKFTALENLVKFIYNGKVQISSPGDLQDFVDVYKLLNINLGKKVSDIVKKIDMSKSVSDLDDSSQEPLGFRCENCDKSFQSRKKLVRHVREVHRKEPTKQKQSYSCEKCGEVYMVRDILSVLMILKVVFSDAASSVVLQL